MIAIEREEGQVIQHKGFTIKSYDPYGMFLVTGPSVPENVKNSQYTSADAAVKAIDAELAGEVKPAPTQIKAKKKD